MAPTVTDVAREAGVSPSTVSRALANGIVHPKTREAVLQAAAKLGYTPNRAARALINGRTGNLGLIVPDIANPYFTAVVKGILAHVRTTDYQLVLADSVEDTGRERECLDAMLRTTDGLLICSPRLDDAELAARVDSGRTVVINRLIDGLACVTTDPTVGVEQALQHLAALGHKHLAYVSGPPGSWSEQRRQAGLAQAAGLGLEVTTVPSVTPTYTSGLLAADLVLATSATAVIAFNDMLAIGILNRLAARGVRVPDDLSLVGNDDIAMAALCAPALTTVATPKEDLGTLAAELLPRLLAEHYRGAPAAPPPPVIVPAALVVRDSTAVAPRR